MIESDEPDSAFVTDEEMQRVDLNLFQSSPTRRQFLHIFGLGITAALLPFSLDAKDLDYIIVTVNAKDKKRKTLGAIIANYCNSEAVLRFYNSRNIPDALKKIATANSLSDPNVVQDGQKIKLPRSILNSTTGVKAQQQKQELAAQFLSPLGGKEKSPIHLCFQGTSQNAPGLQARICPFDRFTAKRGKNRPHNALDVYCPIGTPLYPIKPGIVTGAGKKYITANGQRKTFLRGNGKTVKIQTTDGFTYLYLHLSRVDVNIGDHVTHTTCLGLSGITGNANRANPHLHLHLYHNNQLTDPLHYLPFLE